jgi:hypothetical protein
MGYFSYFVSPNPNLPTGTQITNIAYVQFDENPVIATDQVNDEDPSQGVDPNKMAIVTLDNSPPTSSVTSLPAIEPNSNFTVYWSGTDIGSGVASYNIYVSTNGGGWMLWQSATTNTSATFTGQMYNTYGFVSVATDNVGNQETLRANADAVVIVTDHTPPVLAAITNRTLHVGQGIRFTNVVNDPTVSSPTLQYSLGSGAPAGAWINPTNGHFGWNPGIAQASTTNNISVIVTDNGYPPMSATQSFTVVVQDYIAVSLGSTVVATNSTGSVALPVYASAPITNLQFTLIYPPDQLTNFTLLFNNVLVGTASVTELAPGQAVFALGTGAGQSLLGSQPIGEIEFNSLVNQRSAFVYLQTGTPVALRTDGTLADYTVGGQGRVTIVGQESLVEAVLAGDGGRNLIVYGPLGASYQVESCNILGPERWTDTAMSITMTNLFQSFQLAPDTNSATFYRTRAQ